MIINTALSGGGGSNLQYDMKQYLYFDGSSATVSISGVNGTVVWFDMVNDYWYAAMTSLSDVYNIEPTIIQACPSSLGDSNLRALRLYPDTSPRDEAMVRVDDGVYGSNVSWSQSGSTLYLTAQGANAKFLGSYKLYYLYE